MLERLSYRTSRPRRQHRPRRQIRHGQRAAALRAVTAAKLYMAGSAPTLAAAAESCGSNVHYVQAAIVVLKADNSIVLDRVLAGHFPLLAAAAMTRKFVELVSAYRNAEDSDRVAFARACGIEKIFDTLVAASN